MENHSINKKKIIEIALFYGVILALSRAIIDIILKSLDVDSMTYYVGYVIGFILEIILIILAIKSFKKSNNNLLSFSQALKIGVIMMMITGIAFFMTSAFYDQDFQNRKAIEMVEQYNPDQLEDVTQKIEEAKENPKYFASFGLWLIYFIFLGFVISAIAGAAMKKTEEDHY